MKTKKYTARTLKEATDMMKNDLGNEAMILSTRVIEKFEDGVSKKFFEVLSVVEEESVQVKQYAKSSPQKDEIPEPAVKKNTIIENLGKAAKPFIKKPAHYDEADILKEELQTIIDTLKEKDVSKDILQMILKYLKKSKKFLTVNNLDDYILTGLSSIIETANFTVEKRRSGKVISIVGPTGVGKTTCIAKLAAISKIIHNLDIGIISIDTFRLGAIDQLRIFSEISNVDMLVAYEPQEMPDLIKKLKKKDLIFIDTVGRSQKNSDELKKMKLFFENIKVDETYLALSLTSSSKNLYDAAERYNLFNYDSFIFTKIDEAVTHGNLINLSVRFQKPVIYLTNGQIIPDDILSADAEYMAKLIYNSTTVPA